MIHTAARHALSVVLVVALALAAHAEDWPRFRGPTGQGISAERGLPVKFEKEKDVAWKADIPGEGWSSPIVSGGRVILTSAADGGASCRVLCLDARSGALSWDREVFRQEPRRKEAKNSHATPTPVTDGSRIYAVFGGGGIAALGMDGTPAWTYLDVKFYGQHGLGASPIVHDDLLIMPFDGSSAVGEPRLGWQIPWDASFILALDRASGKPRWTAKRGLSRIAHATPIVIEVAGKPQLLSNAGDVIQGFDLASGTRLWSVPSQGEGVVPSAAAGDGLVFTASGFEKPTIRAVRPATEKDPGLAKISWEQTKGVPMIPSFVYRSPHLFCVTTNGIALCLRGETGEIVWQERIGGSHSASPLWADGKVYFLSEEGECVVIEAGPKFEIEARSQIGEKCQASIAASDGALYVRSEKRLFCIRKGS